MGKLSKKFRQIPPIQAIIQFRRNLCSKSETYKQFREKVRFSKWAVKFYSYPRYRKINKIITQKYKNARLFRPKCPFTQFDLAMKAIEPKTNRQVFIQIATRKHFETKGNFTYEEILDTFKIKNEKYTLVREKIANTAPEKLDDVLEVIEFDHHDDNFLLFVSKFQDFTPIFQHINEIRANVEKQNTIIEQLTFYEKIFTQNNILWFDATPHNIMVLNNGSNIVPIDFVIKQNHTADEIKEANAFALKNLITYLQNAEKAIFKY